MIEDVISKLIQQVPDLVAMIAVVLIFVQAQGKRDKAWTAAIAKLAEQIQKMENVLTQHDASMRVTAKDLSREAKSRRRKNAK